MTIIYILLIVASAFIEISDRCNTKNTLKKIGLAFVMVGALLHLADKNNQMIAVGLFLIFAAELMHVYFHRANRRYYDKLSEKIIP